MQNRWAVLALLFSIRTAMALQFQTVAALSPLMMTTYGVGLADIGWLVGIYLSPGILIALPSAAIGRRFKDHRVVSFGLVLMVLGGLITVLLPEWNAQIAGRLLAGTGGIILNVFMSKMVAEWFDGRELATAMGVFVNSWPVGIATALVILPRVADGIGLAATQGAITTIVALGLLGMLLYAAPAGADQTHGGTSATSINGAAPLVAAPKTPFSPAALICLLCAGGIWALLNGALAMIFAFGPPLLIERGYSAADASATTSIALWVMALGIPIGGVLADRRGQRDLVLGIGLLGYAILMILTPMQSQFLWVFVGLGVFISLTPGASMAMPNDVLSSGNRAFGMGLFFLIYYLIAFLGPVTAGFLSERAGSADQAFYLGAGMLVCAVLCLAVFRILLPRARAAIAA